MLESIAHEVSGSPWTYLLIAALCAGDALLPLLPSETIVITAAVLAAHGDLLVGLVAAMAAAGAFAGDNGAYWVGRSGLRRIAARAEPNSRSAQMLTWAHGQIERHGIGIVIAARFIPGGRTATTYSAGMLAMDWRGRFVPADAAAALTWALYVTGLGYLSGRTFEERLWLPLLLAGVVAATTVCAGELLRRWVAGRRQR